MIRKFLDLLRDKSAPKPERIVLTEAEFKFLARGVCDGGFVGAWSTDGRVWELAKSLVSKELLRPSGSLPGSGSMYRGWSMTSKGINVALSADFTPAPGWYPFGNPDKRDVAT